MSIYMWGTNYWLGISNNASLCMLCVYMMSSILLYLIKNSISHSSLELIFEIWLILSFSVWLYLILFLQHKAVATSPIGGEFLTDCLMKSLESKGIVVGYKLWLLYLSVVKVVWFFCLRFSFLFVQMKPRHSFRRKEIRPGEFQVLCVFMLMT